MTDSREGTVRLSDDEVRTRVENTLDTLTGLCELYDGGQAYTAFSMATEVMKILVGKAAVVRLRGNRSFPTLFHRDRPTNLNAELKLVTVRLQSAPPRVEFLPAFDSPLPRRQSPFREWWGRDIIFRANAAMPGERRGPIPLDPSKQVPYFKRRVLVRRDFVELVRNKFGAHLDEEIPDTLDALLKAQIFGADFAVNVAGEVHSIANGKLPVVSGPAAAMMRMISEEVLVGYGRRQLSAS